MNQYSIRVYLYNCTCIVRCAQCNVKAVAGAAPFCCTYVRRLNMAIAHWFGIGILGGIVLFFILERTGVVYEWFDKWDQ